MSFEKIMESVIRKRDQDAKVKEFWDNVGMLPPSDESEFWKAVEEAVVKQISKPIMVDDHNGYFCPACCTFNQKSDGDEFCPKCGQKLHFV